MQLRADWLSWVQTLRRFQLDGVVSWLLEGGAPVLLLGAQLLYAVQPLWGERRIRLLAQMLEDEQETQAFVRYLRGEGEQ